MKKTVLAIGTFFLMATFVSAQKIPSFATYKVKVGNKISKRPNLASNKNARMYRTNLRNAAQEGVNFAGKYVLASWGCGTGCLEAAIINARTGQVFFPSVLQGISAGFCDLPDYTETLVYKPDSRLLVLSGFKGGAQNGSNKKCGIYYLEWTGANFRQVKYTAKRVMI